MKTLVMQVTKSSVLIASMLLLAQDRVAGQGNLVVNGGFNGNASSWALTNISLGAGYQSLGGDPGGCVALDGPSSLFAFPTASQTITSLTPGTIYTVSGNYRQGKGNSPDYSFGVAMDGVFFFEAATTVPIDLAWYSFSFQYTANSTSAVLSLSSELNGAGVSYVTDNIAMYAVPEPSAAWFLFMGGGILLLSVAAKNLHLKFNHHLL
ncbi:MAG TPA: hypothetical protein VMA35_11905 [Candidatus Sulfopaludibacter sp.]|nr:hypothetical protein [Candidatus Sulfopaludibacter sp.]